MTLRTAATRYARALFDVALKEQADLSRIEADLTAFGELFTQHDALAKALLAASLRPPVPGPDGSVALVTVADRDKDQLPALAEALWLARLGS